MASWDLTCKDCGEDFTHSQVGETLANYFIASKPEFPPEGLEFECPHCKTKSLYLRNELRYQERRIRE